MMRLPLLLMAFLLAGSLFTVALAWRIAAISNPNTIDASDMQAAEAWPRTVPESWPPPDAVIRGRRGGMGIISWRTNEDRIHDITRVSTGWPVHSMSWEYWSDYTVPSRYSKDIIIGPASMWGRGLRMEETWRSLPIRPVWPGFAINTLLFATVAAGIWYGYGAARRALKPQPSTGSGPAAGQPDPSSVDGTQTSS